MVPDAAGKVPANRVAAVIPPEVDAVVAIGMARAPATMDVAGFREYLTGLLAPRDWNKTLTCLAGVEPVEGAPHAAVQRLQYFLTESTWDSDVVSARRLELLLVSPDTAPYARGVLVIDDSGDRKDGTRTAHVGRQWLGRYGKTDNGAVTVTTLWADERVCYPLHAEA